MPSRERHSRLLEACTLESDGLALVPRVGATGQVIQPLGGGFPILKLNP